ncbi:HalOD1 output domain-containing protein [Haladaptatus halobius]|uniref:HalOD1 output domain-containing protein n=1 Tax=Haladaptatus halobius TaxID=2884875 RepID=UPI001D0B5ED8|nr:HalOD1 output domain-containing protein [Haladaptatus halobius]
MESENNSRRTGGTRPGWHNDQSLATAIVERVTAQEDSLGDDLKPLYESIDPDALNALFAPCTDGSDRPGGQVTFTYAGYEVTVTSNYGIEINPLDR